MVNGIITDNRRYPLFDLWKLSRPVVYIGCHPGTEFVSFQKSRNRHKLYEILDEISKNQPRDKNVERITEKNLYSTCNSDSD